MKQRLRETVLEEGDDWRQRLRQVEEENRVVKDKLQMKKELLKNKKKQHEEEIEELTAKFNSQAEKEQEKHSKEKSKIEKELKNMRKRAEKAELDLSKAESLKSSVATNAGNSEAFFQDILVNLKDFLDGQLQCSICNEIYVYPTSINCGHSFCEDCIEGWRKKSANTTCPICRADVVMLSPNQVLDGFIEKFVDNFFPEDAKKQRAELVKERKQKKDARAAKKESGSQTDFVTRRRILNLESDDDDDSWDGHNPLANLLAAEGIWQLAGAPDGGMDTPSSPSNSSINSIPSTTSDNMSFTPERSPFFSDSDDDDSYQPGQEVGDFDLSHLDDLDHSDRFSNEDHEDVEEDDEVDVEDTTEYNGEDNEESDDDDSVEHDGDDSDQYDSPTFSDSDWNE